MYKRILTILLVYIPAGYVVASVLLVTLLKWVPVTVTPLMVKRLIENVGQPGVPVQRTWVPLEQVSESMIRAVIASEDQKFLQHHGFDFEELHKMKEKYSRDEASLRGCSTISQQTAKNCFTFCTHTWVRKFKEAYYTVLIEWIWGKDRIMEVYLNVAEMGRYLYGIEAAAQHYYSVHAYELTLADASSLACCLPNPLRRDPQWVNCNQSPRRAEIAALAQQITIHKK